MSEAAIEHEANKKQRQYWQIVGTRALNRHVFSRGQHAQDQDQTGRGPVITFSAAPGPQGGHRPYGEGGDRGSTGCVRRSVPRLRHRRFHGLCPENTDFDDLHDARAGHPSAPGSRVLVQVAEWHDSDGVTIHSDVMKRVRDEVRAAVRAVDPMATEELDESH